MSHLSKSPENPDDIEHYLQYISSLDMSIKEKYELLHIVGSILNYFVDQAFNVQTDQITLRCAGKADLNSQPSHAMIGNHLESQTDDAGRYGVRTDSNPAGAGEP